MATPPHFAPRRPEREPVLSGDDVRRVGRYLAWQTLLYFTPLLLLAVFLNRQYAAVVAEGRRVHLETVAEYQARTLDVFFRERIASLRNLADSPSFLREGTTARYLGDALGRLQRSCDAVVDLGTVDGAGRLAGYAGPVNYGDDVSYAGESWFVRLTRGPDAFVITDSYMGFRGRPHFTIAVRRTLDAEMVVLRAALSPERIARYLASLEGASEDRAALVNAAGVYQVVPPGLGAPLDPSPFVPPAEPRRGFVASEPGRVPYAFARLPQTSWALVVPESEAAAGGLLSGQGPSVLAFTLLFFAFAGAVSLFRAWQHARRDRVVERHEAELSGQLVQAAKLASVGELAAGIAHEINNPLAIIAEEVGLIQDMQDPVLAAAGDDEPFVLADHLEAIHAAVFRCRDITRKLLTFVRRTEVDLARHDLREVIDEVLDGMLGNELMLANVEVVRDYGASEHELVTDRSQLVQVLVNLVKNAADAMPGGGRLTVRTSEAEGGLVLRVEDTGCGMTREQLGRAFEPFYTTKQPGKGTGLGLSVSLGLVRSLGGSIRAESAPGRGTTFSVELPYEPGEAG